jgi:hypothetical protein
MMIIHSKYGSRFIRLEGEEVLDTTICTEALTAGWPSSEDPWMYAKYPWPSAPVMVNRLFDAIERYFHSPEHTAGGFMKIVDAESGRRTIQFQKSGRLDSQTLYVILRKHEMFRAPAEARVMINMLFDGFAQLIAEQRENAASAASTSLSGHDRA